MSLVTRTVTKNHLPSSFTLLRQVGLAHPQNPTAAFLEDLDEARLAEILRVPVEEVAKRRHLPRSETGYVDFFGVAVRADEIFVRTLRFAPAAVATSPHNRVLWSLKTVPCCTESWEFLASRCDCGALQRWQHAHRFDRCDRCNKLLSSVTAREVPEHQRDGLSFLSGLLDPDPNRRDTSRGMLPEALSSWDGGMIFELALSLLNMVPDRYRHKRTMAPPPDQQAKYALALSQAADIIKEWPASFMPALKDAVGQRSRSKYNVRYTGIADYIPGLESDVLPDVVRDAINEQLAPLRTIPGETPPGQIAMMAAVDRTLLGLGILAKGRRDGLLQSHICLRANRLFPTLDRAEVEDIRDRRDHRKSAEAVSTSLGLPQYAMQRIADAGHLEMQSHPFLVSLFDAPQMDSREHKRFITKLKAAADRWTDADTSEAIVPLHRIARAMGGGLKPWGTIFDLLLRNDRPIPFRLTGTSINRLFIRTQDVDTIRFLDPQDIECSRLPRHCSQRDALEILNLHFKYANTLKELVQADDQWELRWDVVLGLASSRITMAEMIAWTGMHHAYVERLMDSHGCYQVDRLGWNRQSATKVLKHGGF
ncbi:hypothetical protein JQK15_02250 [Sphingobium sp. BHU LFT2]|uniref:hypothetical protein n=1 Tax=Sphingobium sp. BHU LFT2 TaxID=2807634 RepID=UPI001BE8E153|nr:hypothetical protein [Sphingobium sp. BHU LFT2]